PTNQGRWLGQSIYRDGMGAYRTLGGGLDTVGCTDRGNKQRESNRIPKTLSSLHRKRQILFGFLCFPLGTKAGTNPHMVWAFYGKRRGKRSRRCDAVSLVR